MNDDVRRALQIESEFLAGAEANFESAKGRVLRGTSWQTGRGDDAPVLRELLKAHHRYDAAAFKGFPRNRRIAVRGYERQWFFGKRQTGVVIASVVAQLDHLASGDEGAAPPVDLGQLVDYVRGLVTEPEVPHVIGVCSPSGFTEEARMSQLELPNITLVLIEPWEGGGWRVSGVDADTPPQVLGLFDPEATSRKLDRVRGEIEERGADLLTSGLSAGVVANRLDLPEAVVDEAFEQAAMADSELRVSRESGEAFLLRVEEPAEDDAAPKGMIDWIRTLFSREGEEARKINHLSERRAGLSQRRDRIYEHLVKLEAKEAALLEEGRQATSAVTRRRLANQLAQLRKEAARQNTLVSMLNTQIDIIGTDIHNLTLIQQGQMAEMPDTEELTQNAVRAEEMLESLKADADLVASLETGVEEGIASDEEMAILKEFETAVPAEATKEDSPPEAPAVDEAKDVEETPPEDDEPPRRAAEPEI